jgi:hypothetical protein
LRRGPPRDTDAVIDEIPQAYMDIDHVMDDAADLVEVRHTLRQIVNQRRLAGGWSASARQRTHLLGHPAGIGQRVAQQHLDLGVDTAELVIGPARQSIMDRWVDAKEYLLPVLTHV